MNNEPISQEFSYVDLGTILTCTGKVVNPLALRHEDIDLEDIAMGLANSCRFNGQLKHFYSVANHSVRVCKQVGSDQKLWALLHDASEAYLHDIPKPLKLLPQFAFYREAEARVMKTVAERFDLCWPMPPEVHEADQRMLATEFEHIAPIRRKPGGPQPYTEDMFLCWSPAQSYENFIAYLLPYVDPEELPHWTGPSATKKAKKLRVR